VLEHQAVFVNALRRGGCEIRKRIFDVIKQHHANDFGNGRESVELYEELLSALRDSGMAEAMKKFERRFSPLLNPDPPVRNAELGPTRGEGSPRRSHSDAGSKAPRLGQDGYPVCGCIRRHFHRCGQRSQNGRDRAAECDRSYDTFCEGCRTGIPSHDRAGAISRAKVVR